MDVYFCNYREHLLEGLLLIAIAEVLRRSTPMKEGICPSRVVIDNQQVDAEPSRQTLARAPLLSASA
jgi:hypothetical protein